MENSFAVAMGTPGLPPGLFISISANAIVANSVVVGSWNK